ncbi:chromate transporter [Neosynechococcus sphagnicola]|uniref:chromate transporter n=1 Tax=Neosynechococcus sphagnicola TaxID=1501145 RepID=UPI000B1E3AA5|nr:chromate transporter [Neosynechococcus sphagnicola]
MPEPLEEIPGIQRSDVRIFPPQIDPEQNPQRLRELALVFLKLGAIAFGGPAAHIAMMDDEVVNRRQWMSREKLLDLIGGDEFNSWPQLYGTRHSHWL